jgi:hypothetical protein
MNAPVRAKTCKFSLRSKLVDWLESCPQNAATPSQWQGMLNNLQNVRREEIERSNLMGSDFLYDSDFRITKEELVNEASTNLADCHVTLKSYWQTAFRPSLDVITKINQLPKRVEKKAKRFVEQAQTCYQHPSIGYWIIRSNYTDIVTLAPNWIVLDHNGMMLNSCWFPSALEAFDAMHQSIRKILNGYGQEQPIAYYDEYTFLGGNNYQEWFICLPEWPLPYRDGHFKLNQLLVHIRTTERIDHDGKPLLMVEEIQSPWHADIRKHGSTTEAEEIGINELVADAPFAKEWHDLAIKAVIGLAIKNNCAQIGFTTGKQQCARWWNMKGLLNLYDLDIPKCLKKIAAQYDCINDWTTIVTRKPNGKVFRTPQREWVVRDANKIPITPPVKNKDVALHFLNDRSTPVKEQIRVLKISDKLKQAMIEGQIPLFGW